MYGRVNGSGGKIEEINKGRDIAEGRRQAEA